MRESEVDKQELWMALVEWESGGLEGVTDENIVALKKKLEEEMERRGLSEC